MKFSFYFDVSMCIRPAEKNAEKRKTPALESAQKNPNPREGRYFTKPSKEDIEKALEESSISEDIVESSNDSDIPQDTEDPAEEKPIGDEIPEPDLDMGEDPQDEEPDPIEDEAPKEDDEELYAEESSTEESSDNDPLHTSEVIDDLLQMFTQDDGEKEETLVEEDISESTPVEDIPTEEAVGKETPAIPSVLRRVEAEGDETPIPLNVSVEVNKETADRSVDKEEYTDKKEETNESKIMNMISKFSSLPLSQKKDYANEIYQAILDTNANIDLSKYRMIWKLVDHPFIESHSREDT